MRPRIVGKTSILLWASLFLVLLIGNQVDGVKAFTNGQSASLVIGQKDFTTYLATTSQNGFSNPGRVVFDPSGNMWVVDWANNRVLEFKSPFSTDMNASLVLGQKNFITGAPGSGQSGFGVIDSHGDERGPAGAAFDPDGNLWVADSGHNRVLEFKPPFVTGMNASLVIGQKDFATASPGLSRNGLNRPLSGVAFDPSGDLWVLDGGNDRVLEYTPPFSNGMNASVVLGQKDYTSDVLETSQSGLNALVPWCPDLTADLAGNVWVADCGNNRVMEFKRPFSNGMNASTVIGQADFVTGAPSTDKSGLTNPDNVESDPSGNIWVTSGDAKYLEFEPPFSTGMQASMVIGQVNFTSNDWMAGQNGFSGPGKAGFDSAGNMWAPDSGDNRVLEFSCGDNCRVWGTTTTIVSSSAQNNRQGTLSGLQLWALAIGASAVIITVSAGGVLVRKRMNHVSSPQAATPNNQKGGEN